MPPGIAGKSKGPSTMGRAREELKRRISTAASVQTVTGVRQVVMVRFVGVFCRGITLNCGSEISNDSCEPLPSTSSPTLFSDPHPHTLNLLSG